VGNGFSIFDAAGISDSGDRFLSTGRDLSSAFRKSGMCDKVLEPMPDAISSATTSDERTMAVLAHVLQLVGGWIAPLVIFFVKRQSRFVSFHALQVLLFEGVCLFLTMTVIGGAMLAMVFGVFSGTWPSQHGSSVPPAMMFLLFAFIWLGVAGLWLVRLLLAIIYGIKAGRGEWAEYPLLGRLARHILNLPPEVRA
jgi:uncharacterized protein